MFRLNTEKAIQAAAVLLRRDPQNQMGRKRLLALLYIADRDAIKETGRPIIGGRISAMKHGPIHSEILDLLNGKHPDEPRWFEHFGSLDYRVQLKKDPGVLALSRYEIDKLNEISDRFSHLDEWDVADTTHEFPEYRNNYVQGTSKPIELEDIIDAVDRSGDKEAILQDARETAFFDAIFEGRIA